MFCKIGVLNNFGKFTRKTPVSESLFKNFTDWRRMDSFSSEFCKMFQKIFFTEHLGNHSKYEKISRATAFLYDKNKLSCCRNRCLPVFCNKAVTKKIFI